MKTKLLGVLALTLAFAVTAANAADMKAPSKEACAKAKTEGKALEGCKEASK